MAASTIHFLGKTADGKVFRVDSRDKIPSDARRVKDAGMVPGTRNRFAYDGPNVMVLTGTASDVRRRAKGFLSRI
jgi:hypothetical protein